MTCSSDKASIFFGHASIRYWAPEYAEYGIASVKTDVLAFGILLFQLISGRKVLDEHKGRGTHILQWVFLLMSYAYCFVNMLTRLQSTKTHQYQLDFFQAEPLIESLALNELVDDRIKDTYDTFGLYHLARPAYLCVRTIPEQRPSMGEVGLVNSTHVIAIISL